MTLNCLPRRERRKTRDPTKALSGEIERLMTYPRESREAERENVDGGTKSVKQI